jgi:hypothetical protein
MYVGWREGVNLRSESGGIKGRGRDEGRIVRRGGGRREKGRARSRVAKILSGRLLILCVKFDTRPSRSADELPIDGHNTIRMRTKPFDKQTLSYDLI